METNQQDVNNMADILEGKTQPASAPATNQPATDAPAAAPVSSAPEDAKGGETAKGQDLNANKNEPITNTDKTPAQQPLNFDAELERISGGAIKSKDGIAALIEASNRLPEFETQVRDLTKQKTDLEARVANDPFANDYVKRLNELHKSGASESQINAFITINKVKDLDGLDPIDARLLSLQIKNNLTEEEAKIFLKSNYKLDADEFGEDVAKAESIRLKVEANADREFLKTHKAEVSAVPDNQAEKQQREFEQQQADHVAKLSPIAKSVVNDAVNFFKGISINGKEGDQNIVSDFDVSEESIKVMQPLVDNFIKSNWQNIPANEEGTKQIKQYAENLLAIQNYKTWIVNAASQRELQVRAEYNNPTPIKRGNDAPVTGKSSREELDQQILNSYN